MVYLALIAYVSVLTYVLRYEFQAMKNKPYHEKDLGHRPDY